MNIFGIAIILGIFLGLVTILKKATLKNERKKYRRKYVTPIEAEQNEQYQKKEQSKITINDLNFERKKILTNAEFDFFQALKKAFYGRNVNIYIATKVRLWDIVDTVDKLQNLKITAQNMIQSKHLDFVILDWSTMETLLVIELDDTSHLKAKAQYNDNIKDAILAKANIPILRIKRATTYDSSKIFSEIKTKINIQYNITSVMWE